MTGILVVDKPSGWTSFDVIAKLRGALGTRKLGHSGTLDPMATGVLPVFVGPAAKAADMQQNQDKRYEAQVRFGLRTDTGDITGQVLETSQAVIAPESLLAALPAFTGERMQTPPMYSAVKVNGVPLYKLARQGKTVERKARPVTIHSLRCLGQAGENEYRLEIACSKGAYVRTLLEEIGDALGCPAVMSALRRTAAGDYTLAQAHALPEILDAAQNGAVQQLLLPLESVFAQLPLLEAPPAVERRLRNGCPTSHYPAPDGRYRVRDERGAFLGTARVEGHVLRVEKFFLEKDG